MQNLSITDQLVYSTVRIECDFPDGKSGTGTGFFRFFVTSCGFGLIEQAAHWAANQVDHGDEVGLVPVAACA